MRQRRFLKPRLAGALSALLLIGGSLAQWSPVGAQTVPSPSLQAAVTGPTASDSGFTVVQPGMRSYYQQHGGVRTLGKPLSQDFQLVGRRVQIFEQQVLEQRQDGSVQALDLLSDALPLTHAAGETFPTADPDMLSGTPPLEAASYHAQALAAIDDGLLDWAAPDDFNGIPVSFGSTFRNTVGCNDLPTGQPCDDRRLLSGALDVWGLPVSAPTVDPGNSDLVYLRFQRGIMQYSQSTGQTQAVPLGSWFKRVLIGTDLPDDLLSDVLGSRYFAQYAPTLPLGVARASDLPATSLAVAFNASTTTSFLSNGLATDATATPVAPALAPAFPSFGATSTPSALSGSLSGTLPGTSPTDPFALTPSALPTPSGTPSATLAFSTTPGLGASLTTTPAASTGVSSTTALPNAPQGPDPCTGDEQILFSPKKPYVGTDVLVAVTSATHHDVRAVRLTGPVKSGQVTERAGLEGWVWEWTISPTIDGWYEFTFFTDGARACATSGFNALPSFGATAVPSVTATATLFPTVTPIVSATALPTATAVPAPSLATTGVADPACGAAAGQLMRLAGTSFGVSQGTLNGSILFSPTTGSGSTAAAQATIYSWTNTNILLTVPSSLTPGPYDIVVITSAGSSSPITYKVGAC